jgi:anhydro-N-acetylmuramic acid kinase
MKQRKTISDLARRKRLRVAGLMSGTSADGVDVAVIDIDSKRQTVVGFGMVPYPKTLREEIFRLFDPKTLHVDDLCHYNAVIGEIFADALIKICKKASIPFDSIDLIGSHGQTIYHNPVGRRQSGKLIRSTLQIGEPSVIAQRTGITTVADFRPRDMACGGQGAPLVPFADFWLFRHHRLNRAIQNVGGIANITWLPANAEPEQIIAFDTGPGNMVIDGLVRLLTNGRQTFDRHGAWAARGKVNESLLARILKHPYFGQRPPKTCGREQFGLDFCRALLKKSRRLGLHKVDLLATATAVTAVTIARAYRRFLDKVPDQVILCGGGCQNRTLVKMLHEQLENVKFLTTGDFGIDSDAKEAISFAILAWATIKGIANNVPKATGAKNAAVLGKIVPA